MLLISMFMSGMIIPVDVIAKSSALQWISRFTPLRYSTGNIVVASTPYNQTHGFLNTLSADAKSILFDPNHYRSSESWYPSGAKDPLLVLSSSKIGDIFTKDWRVITSFKMLIDEINLGNVTSGPDTELFNALFVNSDSASNVANSSNNIFNFSNWGVQKIVDSDEVKSFVTRYLGASKTGNLSNLYNYIKEGRFTWLDLFFSFTKTLYFKVDKILNISIPIVLSLCIIGVGTKKMKWGNR